MDHTELEDILGSGLLECQMTMKQHEIRLPVAEVSLKLLKITMRINTISHRLLKSARVVLSQRGYFKTTDRTHFLNGKLSSTMSVSQINKEKELFEDARKYIVSSIQTNEKLSQQPEVCAWMQKVFDYNTSGNHKMRGLSTVFAYKLLEKRQNITEEKMKLIRIIGWSIEMYQAYIIMLDDIMDGSTTRRGKLCWYQLPDVGLGALNDSTLIYCTLCDVLKKYFDNTKYYPSIVHLINKYLLYTAIGQHLDNKKIPKEENDYSSFTIEQYIAIIKYKSSIFGFDLPIIAAHLLMEEKDTLPIEEIKKICFDIGIVFQLQNDILDCYGNKAITGKEGTDIQEGKCTWLAVQALQKCDPAQRAVFTECYGRQEPKHVERIKLLYDELHLLDLFRQEENKMYDSIMKQINVISANVPPSIFYQFFETYKEKSLAY